MPHSHPAEVCPGNTMHLSVGIPEVKAQSTSAPEGVGVNCKITTANPKAA